MDKPAFHLICEKPIEGEQFVTSFFNSLFDIKKLVLVKNSLKDKNLVKEIVIILNSQNNIEILNQESCFIGEVKVSSNAVSCDEAEQLIRKNKTKLYVGNIPFGIDNIKLWKHFARFGSLDYTYLIKKPERKAKGFGFIIYEDREGFEKALKAKHYIDGQRLICKMFLNKSQLSKPGEEAEESLQHEVADHDQKKSAGSTNLSEKAEEDQTVQEVRNVPPPSVQGSNKHALQTSSTPFQTGSGALYFEEPQEEVDDDGLDCYWPPQERATQTFVRNTQHFNQPSWPTYQEDEQDLSYGYPSHNYYVPEHLPSTSARYNYYSGNVQQNYYEGTYPSEYSSKAAKSSQRQGVSSFYKNEQRSNYPLQGSSHSSYRIPPSTERTRPEASGWPSSYQDFEYQQSRQQTGYNPSSLKSHLPRGPKSVFRG